MKMNSILLVIIIAFVSMTSAQQDPLLSSLNRSGISEKTLQPGYNPSIWGLDDVTWVQVPSAPTPFIRAGSGVLGNYFYCFGGEDNTWAHAFNLTTEQWEASIPPPFGLGNFAGVATNDAIYLIGRYGSGGFGDEVQKFTPIGGGPTGVWTLVADYPSATSGIAASWDGGNYIYAAGGQASVYDAYRYNITADRWTAIADPPIYLTYAGGAFVLGKFYVLMFGETLIYNPGDNSWTFGAPQPVEIGFTTFNTTFSDSLVFLVAGGGNYSYGSISYPATDAVQVYNPLTDAWTLETPLPVVLGCNSARFVPPDKIISAGGLDSTVYPYYIMYSDATYRGLGFPSSTTAPDVNIELTYLSGSPVPLNGGSIYFGIFVQHVGSLPLDFDAWLDIAYQGGTPTTVVQRSFTNFQAGWTINRPGMFYPIPSGYAAGDYTFTGRVGGYPNDIWDESGFPFVKLGSDNVAGFVPFVVAAAPDPFAEIGGALLPDEATLLDVYPNPFNPATTINFELATLSKINLTVYDLAGREVVALVNGYRDAGRHSITFDGSDLPSGIYFAKLTTGENTVVQKMMLLK